MTAPLKLTVLVPTHNRRDILISRCLPAIFSQDVPASDYEVVVVVDGSTDGTAEALSQLHPPCSLKIIEQPQRGPSAARNNGIQAARGESILFIDDDIICGPHLFQQHIEAHTDAEPALVYGPISIAPGTPPSILKYSIEIWYQKYYGHLDAQNGVRLPQDDYLISNSSIPRATLLACGGFDETMTAKEDYELGLRLWKMGFRFKYLPKARAEEFYLKPSRYVLRNDGKTFGETEVLLCRKHPDYRPYSVLGVLGKLAGWKRLWRHIYASLPVNPVGFLTPLLWMCDKLSRFPAMRRLGHRVLGTGRGVVEFRSAAREAGSWRALRQEFGLRLPTLMYHRVGPVVPGIVRGLTVTPRSFERQIRWLARRGFVGIRPAQWLEWLRTGKGLPDKPVMLTFDDAYADLVEYALPVLRRHGFGAVIFVVTQCVGGTNAWDVASGSSPLQLMSAEQIRHWASQGIEFGAHSRTHPNLTTLSALDLEKEIVGSGDDLARILGGPVVSFAYPYGFYNQSVNDCARRAYGLTFRADEKTPGINFLSTDPHDMQRTMVHPGDTLADFACRIWWGYSPILKLRSRLRLRSRVKRFFGIASGPEGGRK